MGIGCRLRRARYMDGSGSQGDSRLLTDQSCCALESWGIGWGKCMEGEGEEGEGEGEREGEEGEESRPHM